MNNPIRELKEKYDNSINRLTNAAIWEADSRRYKNIEKEIRKALGPEPEWRLVDGQEYSNYRSKFCEMRDKKSEEIGDLRTQVSNEEKDSMSKAYKWHLGRSAVIRVATWGTVLMALAYSCGSSVGCNHDAIIRQKSMVEEKKVHSNRFLDNLDKAVYISDHNDSTKSFFVLTPEESSVLKEIHSKYSKTLDDSVAKYVDVEEKAGDREGKGWIEWLAGIGAAFGFAGAGAYGRHLSKKVADKKAAEILSDHPYLGPGFRI